MRFNHLAIDALAGSQWCGSIVQGKTRALEKKIHLFFGASLSVWPL